MSYSRFIVYTGILVSLCLSCEQPEKQVATTKKRIEHPDQEGWNSTLIATKNGQVTAIIKYGYMERFNKRKIVNFSDSVHVDFFDDMGNHTSKLISDEGRLNESTNNVEAFGNVVVVSDSGITLKTEKIWWDNAIEKVVSDQFVTITTVEHDTLYGVGFESDQNLSNWIIKEVRGKTQKAFDLSLKNKNPKQQNNSQ